MTTIFTVLALFAAVAVLLSLSRGAATRERAAKRNGTYARQFVLVEDDGSIRDLTAEEEKYLNTEFDGADGARPYFKGRYRSRAPDGLIGGFLRRSRVPSGLKVRAVKLPTHEP